MLTDGIHEFVNRDWRAARDRKDDYWGARIARLGPAEGLRIAGELRAQVLSVHPDWPGPEDRDADLASHIRLCELFRRADSASSR